MELAPLQEELEKIRAEEADLDARAHLLATYNRKTKKLTPPNRIRIGWFKHKWVCPNCGSDLELHGITVAQSMAIKYARCLSCDWEWAKYYSWED